VPQSSERKEGETKMSDNVVTWGPMVLLIVVWLFIMWRGGMLRTGQTSWYANQKEQTEEIKKHTALLERIATALEKLKT
jgi:preprotein translocase subunit YajC